MTVEVWYGQPPRHDAEQRALLRLYQYLRSQPEHFTILHNFFVGQSNEIDLVVLKTNGIFLAELKHVTGPVCGGREGPWKIRTPEGKDISFPGHSNPFKQVWNNYNSWKEWCQANAERISAGLSRREAVNWSKSMSYIILYPDIPEESRIEIGDFPVQVVGFETFLFALTACSSQIQLSRTEISRIPQLLELNRWSLPTDAGAPTRDLQEWQLPSFAVLVARGHACSLPILDLLALGKDTVTIGRAPDNDLVIHEPTVSRHHARIYRRQGRWVVRDLNSTSGTFVSYQGEPEKEFRVREGMEFALKNNSIVRFGPVSFTLLLHEEGSL